MTKQSNVIYLIPGQRRFQTYKHSSEVSDIKLDWREYMESTESVSTVTTSASGVTVDSSASSGQTTTHFISGGSADDIAYIDVTVVTDNATPRTFKQRIHFQFEYPTQYNQSSYYI